MISILIPTYHYKVDALVAMLHEQAGHLSSNFEILVYDDGSQDILPENEKINELEHVTYRHFKENRGRSGIRKALAEDAKADLLLFLDADVLPTAPDFLKRYEAQLSNPFDVVCGGILYRDRAEDGRQLRYVYGKKRESREAVARQKEPYIIVTANLLIRKSLFLDSIVELENLYGEDLLLSQQLQQKKAKVVHIDNPVWHLGLECSADYIKKSEQALQNMVRWEKEAKISHDFTSLQRSYLKLKRLGLIPLFRWCIGLLNGLFIKSNLVSKKPGLFWFDMYRLHFYAQKKKNA